MRALEGVQLDWLVGRQQEPTDAFAARFGFDQRTLGLEEALADNAVVVASPNALHARASMGVKPVFRVFGDRLPTYDSLPHHKTRKKGAEP